MQHTQIMVLFSLWACVIYRIPLHHLFGKIQPKPLKTSPANSLQSLFSALLVFKKTLASCFQSSMSYCSKIYIANIILFMNLSHKEVNMRWDKKVGNVKAAAQLDSVCALNEVVYHISLPISSFSHLAWHLQLHRPESEY